MKTIKVDRVYNKVFGVFVAIFGSVIFAISTNAFSANHMGGHQKKMNVSIEKMEHHLDEMKVETDGWKLRAGMIRHAAMMEEAMTLANDMVIETRHKNEKCIKAEKALPAGDETCYQIESHEETQQRLTVILLRHVIDRQNIILRNLGILQKIK